MVGNIRSSAETSQTHERPRGNSRLRAGHVQKRSKPWEFATNYTEHQASASVLSLEGDARAEGPTCRCSGGSVCLSAWSHPNSVSSACEVRTWEPVPLSGLSAGLEFITIRMPGPGPWCGLGVWGDGEGGGGGRGVGGGGGPAGTGSIQSPAQMGLSPLFRPPGRLLWEAASLPLSP